MFEVGPYDKPGIWIFTEMGADTFSDVVRATA